MGVFAGISVWISISGVAVAFFGFSQCFRFSDERMFGCLLIGFVGSLTTLLCLIYQFYIICEIFQGHIEYLATRMRVVFKAPGTNFKGADLEDADFSHAVLNDCNFTHANIKDVNWSHVKGIRSSINFKANPITESKFYKFI